MNSAPIRSHRAPPEKVTRTTPGGADQFVLACNARIDAGDVAFREFELREQENAALRAELAWLESHSVTRTARYIRSRLFIMACIVTTAFAALTWFMLSFNGRLIRVSLVKDWQEMTKPRIQRIDGRAFLVRDIPQSEIDSLVHFLNTVDTTPF